MPVNLFDFDPGQKIFDLECQIERQKILIAELSSALEDLKDTYPPSVAINNIHISSKVARAEGLLIKVKSIK